MLGLGRGDEEFEELEEELRFKVNNGDVMALRHARSNPYPLVVLSFVRCLLTPIPTPSPTAMATATITTINMTSHRFRIHLGRLGL